MSWGYVAVAGATLVSGALGAKGAKDAGRAAGRGADAATAESARQYDQTRQDLAPYRVTGTGALNQIARLFGLPTAAPAGSAATDYSQYRVRAGAVPTANAELYANDPAYRYAWDRALQTEQERKGWKGHDTYWLPATGQDATRINDLMTGYLEEYRNANPASGGGVTAGGSPDMSAFFTSPGYQFRRDEGMRGINNSFAARGGALSGNALRALTDFNSNIASSEFGNYFNQLASVAGIGQTATNQTAAYGADHAANAGRNALYAGDSRASGIQGQANAWGDTINGLAGLYGYWNANRGSRVTPGYGGTGAGGGSYPMTGPRYA